MVVAAFSRLLPHHQPPPQAVLSRTARHVHRLIQIRSAPTRPPLVLSLAPARRPPRSSAQENGDTSETLEEGKGEAAAGGKETYGKKNEEEKQAAASATSSVADEIKVMMEARKKSPSASDMWWGGVAEEVREIEWPAFGSVLGTTGVVLAVIAGSGIALLTVNAILAEVSDRVFAGRGIQDLFG